MRLLQLGVGVVLFLAGLVWFGQGVGWLEGSTMTGSLTWAVLGPVTSAAGAALVVRAARTRR